MTALITGASSGIGAEFARRLAAEGHDLILVARDVERLTAVAHEVQERHRVHVEIVALDLSRPDAGERLWEEVQRRRCDVEFLVNNAGFGLHGDVHDADPRRLEEMIRLNCATLVGLTARFLPPMRERGTGTIVNIASTAAFQPIPHMATYGASKAFVLSFTEALWAENRDHGIRVLAVCPGATDTAFFDVAGEAAAAGPKRTTAQLLDATMRALRSDGPSFVDGPAARFVARVVTRLLPRRTLIAVAGRSVAP